MPPLHRIHVKNVGPIRACELEIPEMLVFIGEQASGKSTLAKLIYFFKSLPEELEAFCLELPSGEEPLAAFEARLSERFERMFGRPEPDRALDVKYDFGEQRWIRLLKSRAGKGLTQWKFSPQLRGSLQQFLRDFPLTKDINVFEEQDVHLLTTFIKRFQTALGLDLRVRLRQPARALFVPAGRSLVSTLSGELQGLRSFNFDPLMRDFAERIAVLRRRFDRPLEELAEPGDARASKGTRGRTQERIQTAARMIPQILRGRYAFEEGQERFYVADQRAIDLRLASAGQQEALWILLILFNALATALPAFAVIEEPEAHLFPRAQHEISRYLSLFKNARNSFGVGLAPNELLITTHSPYILSSLNNLLYAWQLGQQGRLEQVNAIVDEALWLDPASIAVYFVEDGGIRSIIDPELKLIRAEEIDGASAAINREYDALEVLEDA